MNLRYKFILLTFIFTHTAMSPIMATPTDTIGNKKMKEVEVHEKRSPETPGMTDNGRIYWNMESLDRMPHLLGNTDPLRMAQLLPGVATNNDYSAGIHIQGCSSAQSLLEMDGAPIFNASHLLGLFSTFTSSHFRGMSLVKNQHDAGFSNRLGGKLSFHPIDTIARTVHLNATVSFMESEGTLTLPFGQNSTLYVSGRGSYLNPIYGSLMTFDDMHMDYGLQDYNLTFVHSSNERNKLRVSLYHGRDRMDIEQEITQNEHRMQWQNTAAALHWQHYATHFILNQQATVSQYQNHLNINLDMAQLNLKSNILQAGYKNSFEWSRNLIQWFGGMEYNYYHVQPLRFNVTGESIQNQTPHYQEDAHEASLYVQANIPFHTYWDMTVGARLSAFHCHNKSFCMPAPRLTLNWTPSPLHKMSFHYGIYAQYLHQISVSNGGLPIDYWISSSENLKPENAHSFSLSYHFKPSGHIPEFHAEIYYKKLGRQHEFYGSILDGLTSTNYMGNTLIHGEGHNYGVNMILKKNKGKLTGWISYAIGQSLRRFPAINENKWYNATFNRTHDMAIVANYQFNKHWNLGGNFVFASGTPYTRTQNLYVINNTIISEYGKYNGSNLPATHRMDISASYRFSSRKDRVSHSLNFSIYNLYAHHNVLFQYMGYKDGKYGYKSVYSLCRMLPSIGYNLKF